MFLFSEDEDKRVSSLLSRLANYDDAIQPVEVEPGAPGAENGGARPKPKAKANLGALTGVYLPCIQNIFGVIIFIRMSWMTGTAGIPAFFAIVFLCCAVTFCTSISLSAVATNGIVPAGGSYFMISRTLGPEFGGAVGILFFMGTCVAGAMYITGAVEILLNYISPEIALFGDFEADKDILYHNIRVYGTIFLIIIGILVFIGVKFVSKFAPIALICVLISIFSIYLGIFINYNGVNKYKICTIGDRVLSNKNNITCTPEGLAQFFCNINGTAGCVDFYNENKGEIREELAIPGLASGAFWKNFMPKFRDKDDLVSLDNGKYHVDKSYLSQFNYIFVDITSSFAVLVSIYFPSCTGILAGSNRSGDLADAQKAIPLGTLAAQLTTSFVYLSVILLFGASFNPLFIRDKFGESLGKELAVTLISWPHPMVILVGALLSTFGASLQSLVGAPRLLQAIAKDGIIPFLEPLQHVNKRGEPVRAIAVSLVIAEIAILIGNLDFIAPVLTMFFLMCYMFLNLACTVQSLLRTPNWRPRFKYYHWSISLCGIFLCLLVMFLSSWIYTLCAMGLAAFIYKYIEYRGAEKEWGDGIRGLALSAARFSLLRLEEGPPHTKNWRPQLLCLVKLNPDTLELKAHKLLTFASQLKAGKGLTIVASVLEGNFESESGIAQSAKQSLRHSMEKEKVKGFAEVVITGNVTQGLNHIVQTAGLGGLKHNTVMMAWPHKWRHSTSRDKHNRFLSVVRSCTAANAALIVPKGLNLWPENNDRLGGTIDIWWIVHDGGLLILLGYVLSQHRTWRSCKLRVFTVAQLEDNSVQMKKDLEKFLYHLRIEATVEVIEMSDTDVSAYTYERTVLMEQRTQVLQSFGNELSVINAGDSIKPDELNVRRMHTAVKLNEHIINKSHAAKLVIINMPGIPRKMTPGSETNYMEFIEVLTEGLERVILARGAGREVITIFS
ncbi:PREDICTED: solute carrier family 12 member 5-like [Rhagoletis zephyria]|uniref:solute carrier family 12 member 5-like n=1 Tax=Rhagoletis zephyria TaxID=28612 RepID=UPI0008115D06|nr:PREDICTED: solute carrier family 12 member 5-like [Rhagoletis zephyria]